MLREVAACCELCRNSYTQPCAQGAVDGVAAQGKCLQVHECGEVMEEVICMLACPACLRNKERKVLEYCEKSACARSDVCAALRWSC